MTIKSKLEKLKKEFPYEYYLTKKWNKVFKELDFVYIVNGKRFLTEKEAERYIISFKENKKK